jgi:hypothetical protein
LRHLRQEDILIDEVRRPDGNKALSVEMAEKLIKAAWYSAPVRLTDKFVILVDADGKQPAEVLGPFQDSLPRRLGSDITASLQFAFAQWHLEAWYFADSAGLRRYLRRDLGAIDASQPDHIQNPKLHLKNLLAPQLYTSVISEDIAKELSGQVIAQRSPSFQIFLDAIRNGESSMSRSEAV